MKNQCVKWNMKWSKRAFLLLMVSAIASCSTTRQYDFEPRNLELPQDNKPEAQAYKLDGTEANSDSTENNPRITRSVPQPPKQEQPNTALTFEDVMNLEGSAITLNVAALALPEFINEVLSNQLGLSYYLDPRLKTKEDLVTLNIEKPLPPKELYRTVQTVLQSYGVALRNDDGLINVEFSPAGRSTEPPILVSGEALPSVPTTHRPVFYLMDLNVVEAQRAVGWLAQAFEGQNAKFSSDPERNAVWLRGSLDVVKQAAEVVKLVDQPLMRGRHSMRIEPRYLGADVLSARLTQMLRAQGYYALQDRPGAVSLFTIEETNSIIVFANDKTVLGYVEEWVIDLDQPLNQTKGDNVFYYEVKNTAAQSVADTINELRGGSQKVASEKASSDDKTSSISQRGQLVVDNGRNALLFYGSNTDWVTMLPAIEKLDKRPLQVLIEVIVAEVTLSDSFSFGVDWALNNAGSELFGGATPDSVGIVQGALSFFPISSSGNTRAVLTMLASDSKVNILQTPRILVRSGEEASINVGNEIPVLTSSQSSTEGGAITQEVQYRSTGNNLSVKPVIYAGGEVELSISQELSSTVAGSDGLSPTIFTRRVATSLSISDGGSVLVGGLIDTIENEVENKVPFLGDLPLIGKFFGSTSTETSRTELMILIAPYVVRNSDDANAVTKSFKEQLTEQP
jgi:general secretion pathway protein D